MVFFSRFLTLELRGIINRDKIIKEVIDSGTFGGEIKAGRSNNNSNKTDKEISKTFLSIDNFMSKTKANKILKIISKEINNNSSPNKTLINRINNIKHNSNSNNNKPSNKLNKERNNNSNKHSRPNNRPILKLDLFIRTTIQ